MHPLRSCTYLSSWRSAVLMRWRDFPEPFRGIIHWPERWISPSTREDWKVRHLFLFTPENHLPNYFFYLLTDKMDIVKQFKFDPSWDTSSIHPLRLLCQLCGYHFLFYPFELPKSCVGCELVEALPYLVL